MLPIPNHKSSYLFKLNGLESIWLLVQNWSQVKDDKKSLLLKSLQVLLLITILGRFSRLIIYHFITNNLNLVQSRGTESA